MDDFNEKVFPRTFQAIGLMRPIFLILLFLKIAFCQGQIKSLNPFNYNNNKDVNKTYALIVGISDYQDPSIPDLNYAASDANAFASFLLSKDSTDDIKIKLLLNDKATIAQFAIALDWLLENAKENDKVFIYFSGHGDVERKTISQPGFLLCWDAPSRVYMAGGALSLTMLQEVLSTLSIQNKARVTIIADACRSGKLSGSDIGGPQATTSNLAKQYHNEIKILSCQPDEQSIEGLQWGGGRGVFSFHLINGLNGNADTNLDNLVSLKEIERYLEDNVSKEVAPLKQNPFTVGNKTTIVSKISNHSKLDLQNNKDIVSTFSSISLKGMENKVLDSISENIKNIYNNFKLALKNKTFLTPKNNCADSFYKLLIQEPQLSELHDAMTREFAAALQDEAQQVLNLILKTNPEELGLSKTNKLNKYKDFPAYLSKAAELLGSNHYMYKDLMSRKCFFEAYNKHLDNHNYNPELGQICLEKYEEALSWKKDLPHVYFGKMLVHFYQMINPDSAEFNAFKATELAPKWFLPYSVLGYLFAERGSLRDLNKVEYYLKLADKTDSISSNNNIWHIKNWANYYTNTAQFIESENKLKEIIAIDSTLAWPHVHLGNNYQSTYRMFEAEIQFEKAISLDSTNSLGFQKLGEIYHFTHRIEKAEKAFKKAIKLDSFDINSLIGLVSINIYKDNDIQAKQFFDAAISIDSMSVIPYYKTASAYYRSEKFDDAIRVLNLGIQKDSTILDFYIAIAATYLEKGDYEKSESYYNNILKKDSANIFALTGLGHLYKVTAKYDKATIQYQKVLEIDSNYIEAYHSLAQVAIKLNDDKNTEFYLKKALELDSLHERVNQRMGILYTKIKEYKKAELHLKRALKEGSPNKKYVLIDLVTLYCMQEKNDLAFEYLANALNLEYNINDEYLNLNTDHRIESLRKQETRWKLLKQKYSF